MSNFIIKAKKENTGEVFEVLAIDDYFGRHKYGYKIGNAENVIPEYEFNADYKVITPHQELAEKQAKKLSKEIDRCKVIEIIEGMTNHLDEVYPAEELIRKINEL